MDEPQLIKQRKLSGGTEEQTTTENSETNKYTKAPIDKWGCYGRWFRHKLLDGILVGAPVLVTIQRHRTPSRTKLMKFFSFLGTEDFYTVLFVFLYWMVDARLGRLFGVLLAVGFYATGSLKTLLCLPRPPVPPIQPLEKAYDWALPSLHSSLGVICPWYLWLYANVHYELSHFQMGVMCFAIVFWSFGIMLSRLYLGVHSPADIVCGGIVGVLVLSLWMQVDDFVDFYISQRAELQIKLFIGIVVLLFCHPPTERGNPSYPDTCSLSGVLCGIMIGRSRQRSRGWPTLLDISPHISMSSFFMYMIARMILGTMVVAVTKIVVKAVVKRVVLQIFAWCGASTYSGKEYGAQYPLNKHYNSHFLLPPIVETPTCEKEDTKAEEMELKAESNTSSSSSEDSTTGSGGSMKGGKKNQSEEDSVDENTQFHFAHVFQGCPADGASWKENWNHDIPVNQIMYGIATYVAIDVIPQIFIYFGI